MRYSRVQWVSEFKNALGPTKELTLGMTCQSADL